MSEQLTTFESKAVSKQLSEADLTDQAISTIERATILAFPKAALVAERLQEMDGAPLSDRILVYPLPPDERFGQIVIPETARQDQTCGIVVAVGRGKYQNGILVPCEVKIGNFVIFSKFSGRTLKILDIEVVQIIEGDINFKAGR